MRWRGRASDPAPLTVLERPDHDGRRDGSGAVGVVRPHHHRILHPWPERRHHLTPTAAGAHAHHTKVVGAVVAQTGTREAAVTTGGRRERHSASSAILFPAGRSPTLANWSAAR